MEWGEIRHLLLGNIRSWMRLPIFDRGGVLTVGYGYPNLCISEGYNAPGSPYWAMKVFAVLALVSRCGILLARKKILRKNSPSCKKYPHIVVRVFLFFLP